MSSAACKNDLSQDAPLEILLADDTSAQRQPLAELLVGCGYRVETSALGDSTLERAGARTYDVVILDVANPFTDAPAQVRHLKRVSPSSDVIVLSAHGSIQEAVAVTKAKGIYVAVPYSQGELLETIAGIARRRTQSQAESEQARETAGGPPVLVGRSPALVQLKHHLEVIARSEGTVLICGESGTGKELVARMIHHSSARRSKPLVTINCAAFPDTLLEAELFGHERGAFTGASSRREGRFEAADGGTLFLDEIGEIPLPAQAKLLRVLEDGSFQRLGSNTTLRPNVRVVAATNRDLEELVRQGKFREDLFYRLKLFRLVTPPLRERPGDLPLLVEHFSRKYAPADTTPPTFSPRAWSLLTMHAFPGNLRELEHAVRYALAFSGGEEIQVEHLPEEIAGGCGLGREPLPLPVTMPMATPPQPVMAMASAPSMSPNTEPTPMPNQASPTDPPVGLLEEALVEFERDYVMRALATTGGNRSLTAALLGISRKALWAKLKRYPAPRPRLTMVQS
jgi:DNA-binding NtrC family response regulator